MENVLQWGKSRHPRETYPCMFKAGTGISGPEIVEVYNWLGVRLCRHDE